MTDAKDTDLEALFADLRAAPAPEISELGMARMMRDAERLQPAPPMGFWAGIGGWAGAGGLVAASLAGLWIGWAPPVGIGDYLGPISGEAVAVTLPGESDFLTLLEDG